jgi:Zn-dependent protease
MIASLFSNPLLFVAWIAAIAVTLTVHEFSHAAVAVLLGDETPRRSGRLTLNPLAHADLLGTTMMLFVGFGWAKPVPFNPYNLRIQRWGATIVALAGPLSNLALVLVFGLLNLAIVSSLGATNLLSIFCSLIVIASAGLFLFNLIPIPPLDGSKFLLDALSDPQYARTRFLLETQGPLLLLGLIFLDRLTGISLFGTLFDGIIGFIARIFQIGF